MSKYIRSAAKPMIAAVALLTLASSNAMGASGTWTSSPGGAVPDGPGGCNDTQGVILEDTISIGDMGTITDVDVSLDIEHSWVGDLLIELVSPQGTSITLVELVGNASAPGDGGCGFSSNNIQTLLDDESGGGAVEDGNPPSAASYTPHEALAAFDGQELSGDWTLRVSDWSGADIGVLNEWGVTIEYELPLPPEPPKPVPTLGVGGLLGLILMVGGLGSGWLRRGRRRK